MFLSEALTLNIFDTFDWNYVTKRKYTLNKRDIAEKVFLCLAII